MPKLTEAERQRRHPVWHTRRGPGMAIITGFSHWSDEETAGRHEAFVSAVGGRDLGPQAGCGAGVNKGNQSIAAYPVTIRTIL